MGWLYDGDIYGGGDAVTMPADDVTLVAQWSPINYTVAYNANGGAGAPADNTIYHIGDPATVSSAIPTRVGYTFTGWLYDGNIYRGGDALTMPAGNVELVAQWIPINYTVAYNANGGAGAPADNNNYNVGNTATVSSAIPMRVGYTFTGWLYGGSVYHGGDSLTMPAANITLLAQWTANNYTVTYDANGGAGAPADANNPYNVGNTVTVMGGEPTRAGYTFVGWLYGGRIYRANNTLLMPATDITLVAQWVTDSTPPAVVAALLATFADEEVPLMGRGIGLKNITVGYSID